MSQEILQDHLNDQEIVRRQKVEKLRELGIDPFGQAFDQTDWSLDIRNKVSGLTHEEVEAMNVEVSIAGRIIISPPSFRNS